MLTPRLRSESGFTLVEALVAGLILVIGVLGGVSVFDSSRHESATGERLEVAQAKAEAELERMRDVPYSQLATDSSQAWPTSGKPGDPVNRVVSGSPPSFKTSGSTSEELVRSAAGTGIKPYSAPQPVVVGGVQYSMSVYRFVSWRDVECRVADLTLLKAHYNALIQPLITRLSDVSSVADVILSPSVVPSFANDLIGLKATAAAVKAKLQALLTAINNLNEIDPCDVDVTALNQIDETLASLKPTLDDLYSALVAANIAPRCTKPLIILCLEPSQSAYQTATDKIHAFQSRNWAADIDSLVTLVTGINGSNHTHNTKRVTVAVVLDPGSSSGPFKPVWATSVISDPNAGFLTG